MALPKVLVFTITYSGKDYCLEDFVEHNKKLTYPNMRHIFIDNTDDNGEYAERLKSFGLETFRVERGNNSREALSRSQNFARNIAIEEGYDYLFSLESDIFCPHNIIEALMIQAKDVITGLYFIGDRNKGQRVPCITLPKYLPEKGYWGTRLLTVEEWPEYLNKGLKKVAAGGFGCCLVRSNIFKKYPFFYCPELKGHSDIYFFNDLWKDGRKVYVHTDAVCDHRNSLWADVKDR